MNSGQSQAEGSGNPPEHNKPHIWASIGWSQLSLPDFAFTLRHEDQNAPGSGANQFNPLKFLGRNTDDDGRSDNGNRLDFGYGGIAVNSGGDPVLYLGVKGFYAAYNSNSAVSCDETATNIGDRPGSTCTFIPLTTEADDINSYQVGASEKHSGSVSRDVTNWGASIEALVNDRSKKPIALKFGAAYKAIDQDMHYHTNGLHYRSTNSYGYADYREDLKTQYWGGYVGAVGEVAFGNGLSLGIDGEAGVYYALTDYKGKYDYDIFLANSSSLELSDGDMSFIASLKVELKQKFRYFNISAFALGEYYSHVPKIVYKSNDIRGTVAPSTGLSGDADRTRIDSGDAWGITTGIRASVPLN